MNDCFFFYLDRFHKLDEEKCSFFQNSTYLPSFILDIVFQYCPLSELLCSKSINVFLEIFHILQPHINY
eukprot:UN33327